MSRPRRRAATAGNSASRSSVASRMASALLAGTVMAPRRARNRTPPIVSEGRGGARLDRVRSYVSRHGCLTLEGAEVALAAIPARSRRFRAFSQPEVLAAVAARLGLRGELDEFILENVADPELAAQRTRQLRRDARPLAPPAAS